MLTECVRFSSGHCNQDNGRHKGKPIVNYSGDDDRKDFEREQRAKATAIHSDAELQNLSLATTTVADRRGFSYVWRWLGLPIIQMPTDIVALQEVVWETRPEVIVETGVARGGSLILFASLLQLLGEGKVIGVDIEIRPHNRQAIEEHPLAERVVLIEGSSTDLAVLSRVREEIGNLERVMVVLDSDHTHSHVLSELRAYGPLVSAGQYLVVADTIVEHLPVQEHRPRPWGPGNNPDTAIREFLSETDAFEIDTYINGKLLMSSSPNGYLRKGGKD